MNGIINIREFFSKIDDNKNSIISKTLEAGNFISSSLEKIQNIFNDSPVDETDFSQNLQDRLSFIPSSMYKLQNIFIDLKNTVENCVKNLEEFGNIELSMANRILDLRGQIDAQTAIASSYSQRLGELSNGLKTLPYTIGGGAFLTLVGGWSLSHAYNKKSKKVLSAIVGSVSLLGGVTLLGYSIHKIDILSRVALRT